MRLIITPPLDGATNMAIDHAIMEAVGEGRVPPTLRLYAWQPACLSLGYGQSMRDVDVERLTTKGWMLVRRPTGGKAILHTDELTYSISLPQDHPLVEGDIVTSYRRLSDALHRTLEILGVKSVAERHQKPESLGAVCFEVPSDYEITVGGKKLVGSAQVRRHKAVLQHGSLPLWGDISRICDALVYPDELAREDAREQVKQRATTIDAAGKKVTWERAATAMQQAFSEAFDLSFERAELTPDESIRLEQLRREQYSNLDWTYRR